MSNEFPPLIGKYKVLGIIAKGGMGVVYKALHPSLKRYVVIKKMTAKSRAGNAERFKKEAQILLDLQSPYIVHLFDYFTEAGFRYMVEELVDGEALDSLIKKQTCIPCPVAMLIMQDCCYALKYAHSKNIIHRDIKPGNILISKRGEIKLADFGIASDANDDDNDKSLKKGMALGTPSYMPPEQFEDSRKVDKRADIYALGIMLYEMLTGTKPYQFTTVGKMLKTVKKGKYISPRRLDKTIPLRISHLIKKMIQPKKQRRYKSVEGVLKVVKKYLKHYDVHEIRVQLAKSVIAKKTYQFPEIQPKDKKSRFVRRIILAAAAVIILIFGCWKSGLVHRTLLRNTYTPVKLEVKMQKSLAEFMDLPVNVFFFENDNDDIPEIKGSRKTLYLKGSRFFEKIGAKLGRKKLGRKEKKSEQKIENKELVEESKNDIYTMNSIFLKQGDYRLKIVVGPYVWWKSFTVGKENCLIECDYLTNIKRQLSIETAAYDRNTNEDISEKTEFTILYGDEWIPLKDMKTEKLVSGTVWRILAKCEGYEDEYFSLLIDWYQDDLMICASLKPYNRGATGQN